jgi:transaldolase/glucose-6-phosphate isomerase
LLAYFEESDAHDELLQAIRARLRDATRCATTTGYGPRFLHSTGQLHKGGPATGVFMQLTGGGHADVPIPNEKFTFGVLVRAQAIGDFQSLASRKRRAVSIALGDDVDAGLATLAKTVTESLAKVTK